MASIEKRQLERRESFVVRYRDPNGRQRGKTFRTMREARAYADKVETQVREGDWLDPRLSRELYGSFHARWVASRRPSPSRAHAEESQARLYILPRWAGIPINRIRPMEIQEWINHLQRPTPAKSKGRGAKPISDKAEPAGDTTKQMVLAQFKLSLEAAVQDGVLRANPAAAVRPPTVHRKQVLAKDVLTADELSLLMEHLPERWEALVYLSAWLGWRWSEAMGLLRRDVDLETGVVHVGNQVRVEVNGRFHDRIGGKTRSSTRAVPLPEPAIGVLRRHLASPFSEIGPTGRVFITESGSTPQRSNFRRVFQDAVERAGLGDRGLNVRQLRHTAATLMLGTGMTVLDVQQRLGHSRASTTLDIYARVLDHSRSDGTQRLGDAMARSGGIPGQLKTVATS